MKPEVHSRRGLLQAGSAALALAIVSRAAHAEDVPSIKPIAPGAGPRLRVMRLKDQPIVTPEMLPGADGKNINGPSLIRVPAWIDKPLGKYYLYFAHHNGSYIRLAYADQIEGPWKVHEPGTLRLADAPG